MVFEYLPESGLETGINFMIIRKARLSDLSILLEFEQAIIEYERPFETLMQTTPFNYYDLKELINRDDAEVLVAEIDAQVIASGYAKLKKSQDYLNEDSHSFLGFMFVAEKHRGKGVNQDLINQLIEWSKQQGMTSVSLTVFGENKSAIRAYKKLGFREQLIEMRLDLN